MDKLRTKKVRLEEKLNKMVKRTEIEEEDQCKQQRREGYERDGQF